MEPIDRTDLLKKATGPVDKLVIQLRAYVEPDDKPKNTYPSDPVKPSDFSLIFDTETTTDPSQRLRFGTFQLRARGHLVERGAFYNEDASVFSASDHEILTKVIEQEEPSDAGEKLLLFTRTQFVKYFFKWASTDATIIGFNLPFDLSRLAVSYTSAKYGMKGGFSFVLDPEEAVPNVRVKHLSQRSQFIDFSGTEKTSGRKTKDNEYIPVPRGFFVDVKTLAAALTSQSHSLKSLSKTLNVQFKENSEEHGKPLTWTYVEYAMKDTQVTWECFEALAEKYAAYNLSETGLHELFSEASLGKVLLEAMGIKSWRKVQPDFAAPRVGNILSSYFGGRAEVHIRRSIVPVIHCDFLAMYPTVCTLMGLWQFVIAQGMTERDDTEAVRQFVGTCTITDLQSPAIWRDLTVLVQAMPDDDVFPVRAKYEDDDAPIGGDEETVSATIGLNYLTSPRPLWFTLADVLASKILSGKAPNILQAIRFTPLPPQEGLKSIHIGDEMIDPIRGDFYRDLINRRRLVVAKRDALPEDARGPLNSEQLALKILANATSYGIFVEINVSELDRKKVFTCHGVGDSPFKIKSGKIERSGRFFHPLLGTLITGAARLMLALAEKQVLDAGLNWAFCDTDSLAIANTTGLEHSAFVAKVEMVRSWFEPLNPYNLKGSILQLEKTNFPNGKVGESSTIVEPECLAISAKRYVLFNRDPNGNPIIRKASAHGLGHLLPPYDDPDKGKRIEKIGVELWQEDYWKAIIKAADGDKPDVVNTSGLVGFDQPAASRYAATKPSLLRWFQIYNEGVPHSRHIGPFNFLLVLQAKSKVEMAKVDPTALSSPDWTKRHPRPAAPYFKTATLAAPYAFDRDSKNGGQVPVAWLKTHGRSLNLFHLHKETKFRGGNYDESGFLSRRHVFALAVQSIGKEADNLEEREAVGDDDGSIEYQLSLEERHCLIASVKAARNLAGVREFTKMGRISHHTLKAILAGSASHDGVLTRLAPMAERLIAHRKKEQSDIAKLLDLVRERVSVHGRAFVARELDVDPSHLSRVLAGKVSPSSEMLVSIEKIGSI